MSSLLEIEGLEKRFDGVKALSRLSFTVNQGEIVGLIGPNGAGKTTLFNVLTGFTTPDCGKAFFREVNLLDLPPYKIVSAGVARTFQNIRLISRLSVLENVLLAFQNQPGERLANIFFHNRAVARREAANKEKALSLLNDVGLTTKINDPADAISYGQQKLLSLVCCLAADAELLLLDEPVAGIAPAFIENILTVIRSLSAQGKTIILIEHNIDAVTQVCDRVIFMDAGTIVSEGTPEEVKCDPKVIEAYLD